MTGPPADGQGQDGSGTPAPAGETPAPPGGSPAAAPGGNPPTPGGTAAADLDMILEEIDQVVEPVTESVGMAPAVGIAVAGGPMITLPEESRPSAPGAGTDSIRSGLTQAGPVAIAGLVVNGAGGTPGHRRGPAGHSPGLRGHRPAVGPVLHPCPCPARRCWSAWSGG